MFTLKIKERNPCYLELQKSKYDLYAFIIQVVCLALMEIGSLG